MSCKKAHTGCDEYRPCHRCRRLGKECYDTLNSIYKKYRTPPIAKTKPIVEKINVKKPEEMPNTMVIIGGHAAPYRLCLRQVRERSPGAAIVVGARKKAIATRVYGTTFEMEKANRAIIWRDDGGDEIALIQGAKDVSIRSGE